MPMQNTQSRENISSNKDSKISALNNSEGKSSEIISSLKDKLGELGKITQEVAADSIEELQKNVSKYYHKGQEKIQKIEEKVEGQIKHHPMRAVLISLGVGLVLGWAVKKRFKAKN